MVIDGKTVVCQSWWNAQKPEVKAAIEKGGVVVMSDHEWNKLGKMLKREAEERKRIARTGRTMTTSEIRRQLGL